MSPLSTEYAMLLSGVYDTALPPVKLYEPRTRKNSAKTRVSTAESISLFGGGQGIGPLAQDFKPPGEMARRMMAPLVLLSRPGMASLSLRVAV